MICIFAKVGWFSNTFCFCKYFSICQACTLKVNWPNFVKMQWLMIMCVDEEQVIVCTKITLFLFLAFLVVPGRHLYSHFILVVEAWRAFLHGMFLTVHTQKCFFFLSQHCSSTTFCHFLYDSHSELLFAYSISAVLTELFGIRIKISIDRPQRGHRYIMYSDCMFSSVFVACNTREDFSTESDERKGIISILSFPL